MFKHLHYKVCFGWINMNNYISSSTKSFHKEIFSVKSSDNFDSNLFKNSFQTFM